jgi:hypothetical protein
MTAAELLRNAQPPVDDGMIDQAIADLDMKIWEWAESLKSAQTQLRSAFAASARPVTRPSAALYDDLPVKISPAAAAAAAAATLPPTPPTPEWMKMPAPAETPAWSPTTVSDAPFAPPQGAGAGEAPAWPQQHGGHGASSSSGPAPSQSTGMMPASGGAAMPWPSAPGAPTAMSWPDQQAAGNSSSGVQQWPTWTPTDTSAGGGSGKKGGGAPSTSMRATKAPKSTRETPLPGPTPEERAQKAAAEEALLSELEEAVARRVRLLRRLDPDTAIEKLIEKARQGQAEAASAAPARDDKSSSWWRRK